MKPLLTIAATALALTACVTPVREAYQPPASGATAELRLRNATPGRTAVALFDDARRCTGRRHTPDLLVGEEQLLTVPAGRPLAFNVRYTVPNRTPTHTCEVTASFEPQAGGQYLASIEPKGSDSCTVQMKRLDNNRGVTATARSAVKPEAPEDGYCLPLN